MVGAEMSRLNSQEPAKVEAGVPVGVYQQTLGAPLVSALVVGLLPAVVLATRFEVQTVGAPPPETAVFVKNHFWFPGRS